MNKTIKFFRDYFDGCGEVLYKEGDIITGDEVAIYVHHGYADYHAEQVQDAPKQVKKKVSKS